MTENEEKALLTYVGICMDYRLMLRSAKPLPACQRCRQRIQCFSFFLGLQRRPWTKEEVQMLELFDLQEGAKHGNAV